MPEAARPTPVSPDFAREFRQLLGGRGFVPFDQFMQLALYHPTLGYYRRDKPRVGYGEGTDFFTATTSGAIFGEFIVAAVEKLLRERGCQPQDYTFVEIGAEPDAGVLKNVAHHFRGTRIARVGESIEMDGRCVVFSNELFDAQPCRRFIYRAGQWLTRGVAINDDDTLRETEHPIASSDLPPDLPADAAEGYQLDSPEASGALAHQIARQPWSGLFIACDYGKSWAELTTATPAGTARAYFQHTQSNDLLARPGEQDLTCHICWDWLENALKQNGFTQTAVESQEAFFVHHAGDYIARVMATEASRMSQRKLSLMQLLHPAHLGQKFQVLHGWRQ